MPYICVFLFLNLNLNGEFWPENSLTTTHFLQKAGQLIFHAAYWTKKSPNSSEGTHGLNWKLSFLYSSSILDREIAHSNCHQYLI